MKLYEIPKGSKILLEITNGDTSEQQLCTFNNVDGMYSNISTPDGHTVHLAAYTPLKKEEDYYVIDGGSNA